MSENARRYNSNKIDYTLIPLAGRKERARVWMRGEIKYDRNNWQKLWGDDTLLVCMQSLLRHSTALESGEHIDPETGLSHAALIGANADMIVEWQSRQGLLATDEEFEKILDKAREERRLKDEEKRQETQDERIMFDELAKAFIESCSTVEASQRVDGVPYYVRSDGMIEECPADGGVCDGGCKNCTCKDPIDMSEVPF